jgi:hypothetical protein
MKRKRIFVIYDAIHAEFQEGEFGNLDDAIAELKRRAMLPWDELPNIAPCSNWKQCGRKYEIVEYDVSKEPWNETQRFPMMDISSSGVVWQSDI